MENLTSNNGSLEHSQQQYYSCQNSPLTSSLTKQETNPYTSTTSPVGKANTAVTTTSKRIANDSPPTYQRKLSKLAHDATITPIDVGHKNNNENNNNKERATITYANIRNDVTITYTSSDTPPHSTTTSTNILVPSTIRQDVFESELPNWKIHTDAWAFLQSLHPDYRCQYLTRQSAEGNSSTGYLFGRRPECDFTFHQNEISKRHCFIYMERGCDSNKESGISIYLEDISSNGTFVNGNRVGTGQRVLLRSGDRIQLYRRDCFAEDDKRHLFYRIILPPNFEVTEFHTMYRVGRPLGKGNFATVYKAYNRVEASEGSQPRYVAVKSIKKSKLDKKPRLLPSIIQEIGILMSLEAHPCVIKIEKVFDEPKYIYLVLEYVRGGDLFDLVSGNVCLTEEQTRFIFFQLFAGIKFLHDRHVVHRDLKPENVLVVDPVKLQVKISDFGLAKTTSAKQQNLDSQCGTPNYVAPEILDPAGLRNYNKSCDLWSLGVILYICLCGFPPFNDDMAPPSMKEQIRGGIYSYPAKYWDHISAEAKDLIDRLLTVDPSSRIQVEDARMHPWMTMDLEDLRTRVQGLDDTALDLLQHYEVFASVPQTQLINSQFHL